MVTLQVPLAEIPLKAFWGTSLPVNSIAPPGNNVIVPVVPIAAVVPVGDRNAVTWQSHQVRCQRHEIAALRSQ